MQSLAGTVLASSPLNTHHLLDSFGLAGLIIIIFAECGLLIGFFLPGDTLLFAAGLLLAIGKLHTPLWAFLVTVPIAAVAGNVVGYWIVYRAGPRVFDRPDSALFKPEYVARLLRTVRVVDDHPGPVRAGRAHRGHRDGRGEQDALPDLRALLGHRRGPVDDRGDPGRILARQHRLRPRPRRAADRPGADRRRAPVAGARDGPLAARAPHRPPPQQRGRLTVRDLLAVLLQGRIARREVDADERRVALLGVAVDRVALRPDEDAQPDDDHPENQPGSQLLKDEGQQHAGYHYHGDDEDADGLGLVRAERFAHGRAR